MVKSAFFFLLLLTLVACADGGSGDGGRTDVSVDPDQDPPVITLLGTTPINIELGTPYNDSGATAVDDIDGNISASIVTTSNVNINAVGSYTVTYNVSDAAGNAAIQMTRTVNVTPDVTPPVITLLGTTPVDIELGTPYNDSGATAVDDIDGNISASIVTTSNVNINAVGSYTVTYNVSDAVGNAATQVARTVNVTPVGTPDVTPPVITLLGSTPVDIELGTPYNDAGATAADNIDGDITTNIVTTSNVNINAVGNYTVTYNVSDAAGNAAFQVIRTVNVTPDATPPVITLLGSTPVDTELGTPYDDAGATAADNIDGDITANIVTTSNVNINAVGNYTVTYNVSDAAGNAAFQATRTVNVTPDITPPGNYRTVVILGDTQAFVGGGSSRYVDFQAQIQWIIDNKETENIDFVMAAGDLIDAGTTLPVGRRGFLGTGAECDGENPDASYTGPYESFAFCGAQSDPSGSETSCEALSTPTTGCFWYDDTFNPPDCLPCSRAREANTEWGRFDTQFDRLLPGGDTAAGIPFLLTKGNHDNPGNDFVIDPDREPEGWNQRYNAAFWDSLNGTYTDRAYEHTGQNLDVEGDSHSWVVQIGTQPVLVVAIPYISGSGVPAAAQAWATNQMTAPVDADKPAILLVHHIATVRPAITNQSEMVAPNLFLVSGGHVGTAAGGNVKGFRTNSGEIVLETSTDWTHSARNDTNGNSQNDYITLIRFYNDGTMQAFDYSVSGDALDSAAANTISRQAFDILPP